MSSLPPTGYAACPMADRGAFWCCWEDSNAVIDEPLACGFAPSLEEAIAAGRRLADTAVEGSRPVASEHADRVLAAIQRDRRWLPRLPATTSPADYCRDLSYDAALRIATRCYRPSWGTTNELAAAEKAITALLSGGMEATPMRFRGR